MSHVLMIDNYDSFTWNLYQYLNQLKYCGRVDVYRNDKIDIAGIEALDPDLIFISPGPGHPLTDAGVSKGVIEHFKGKKPIIGVCMGLQCIFEAFGGKVTYAGEIVHGKTTTIKHDGKGMFTDVPQSVAVTRYHSLAGSLSTLPDDLEVTSTTETNPEVIMGVRHKKYAIEGVQFHPESILTESGQLMIDNIVRLKSPYWTKGDVAPKKSILHTIYEQRQKDYVDIEKLPGNSFEELTTYYEQGIAPKVVNFYDRLKNSEGNSIVSEFKRASPSKGIINIKANPVIQASDYAKNGCSAISVLTEPHYFKGSLEDLQRIRRSFGDSESRPAILRKEFIFNKYQILEARLAGADSVLLIVKMLTPQQLQSLYTYSVSLEMTPLVEINNEEELEIVNKLEINEPIVVGVNNRNLVSFDVDLSTTTNLVDKIKKIDNVVVLALSGITLAEDVKKYKEQGVDGYLIGESLMRAQEKGKAGEFLRQLIDA